MIKPILACNNPFKTSDIYSSVGWKVDFSQSVESGDPLVGVSLFENQVLLGITEGYVKDDEIKYIGCGVEIYITVPKKYIYEIYNNHKILNPTNLEVQPWGDLAFEVMIDGYKFMIASS